MAKEFKANSISKTSNVFLNIVFGLYSLICIIPLILVLIVSFTDEAVIDKVGYSFFPQKLDVAAYKYVFLNSQAIINAYGITIFVTIVGSVLSLLVIALYAYPISRSDFRYKNLFTFLAFFTMLFGGGLVPWYLVCTQLLHLKDNILGLIVPYLMNAWYVLIMRTFFTTGIPDSIIESAKIDGAGEFRIFATIVLPLAKPALATIGLFSTLAYWNDYWLPMMLITQDKLVNLQYAMYRIQMSIQYLTQLANNAQATDQISKMPTEAVRMAMAVLAVGPIVLAYPFFQKYFVKGLTIGAVKG